MMMDKTSRDIVRDELNSLTSAAQQTFSQIQSFAIAETWKILQLLVASTVRIIENVATDLAGSEKKELAMEVIENFYDTIFTHIDLPFLPSAIESVLHQYIKKILMILVDSAIDAMVATLKDVGVFTKESVEIQTERQKQKPYKDFLTHIGKITGDILL
jgi:hypothetical protein